MLKACSKCGKVHAYNFKCTANKTIIKDDEYKLRQKNKWHKKSEEIRENANYLCEVCKQEGIYNYKRISVHHILKLKLRPDLLLENSNLIALCDEHHKKADAGEIPIEYLQELAKKRDEENE